MIVLVVAIHSGMETPMAVEVRILDPDLLQLPHDLPSPSGQPAEKLLDDLFTQWLSLPDTQRVVCTKTSL